MSKCKVLQAESSGGYVLKLVGEVRLNSCSSIDASIDAITQDPSFATLVVDLSETALIDSTTLGLLAKLAVKARAKSHFMPSIISTNPDITRILRTMGFETVFIILNEPVDTHAALVELSQKELDEEALRTKVLCAHRVLMELNEHNREQFKDLVRTLEMEDNAQLSSQAG